jgi:hypothetical protein
VSVVGAQERNQVDRNERVVAEVTSCPSVSAEAVHRILGIEIGDLLAPADMATVPGSVRLTIRCAGTVAWVEAAAADGSDAVDRTLRLDDFPGDAAPRALALAGLELLAARSPAVRARIEAKQLAAPPSPAPSALAKVGEAAAPSRSTPDVAGARLGLALVWRGFLAGQGVSAWGGQAFLDWDAGRRWQLHVDAEGAGSHRDVALGETSAVLLSCSGAVGVRAGSGNLGLGLGLGARVGLVRLAGSAADRAIASDASAIRPWGGPIARVSAWVGAGPVVLLLGVEGGRSLGTARGLAGDVPVLVIQDTWLAISLAGAMRM